VCAGCQHRILLTRRELAKRAKTITPQETHEATTH
jgi:hypothetical protein